MRLRRWMWFLEFNLSIPLSVCFYRSVHHSLPHSLWTDERSICQKQMGHMDGKPYPTVTPPPKQEGTNEKIILVQTDIYIHLSKHRLSLFLHSTKVSFSDRFLLLVWQWPICHRDSYDKHAFIFVRVGWCLCFSLLCVLAPHTRVAVHPRYDDGDNDQKCEF